MTTMGEKIKNLRKNQAWTQEELAIKIGVTRFAVANWELGRRIPPTDKICKLAIVFNVATDFLIEHETTEQISIDSFLAKAKEIFSSDTISMEDKQYIMDSIAINYIEARRRLR